MSILTRGDCDNCASTDVTLWPEPDSDRYICDECIDQHDDVILARAQMLAGQVMGA